MLRVCLLLVILGLPAFGQAFKFENHADKRLTVGYDRFRDESILTTKPEPVKVKVPFGRGSGLLTLTALVLFPGKSIDKRPESIILILSPGVRAFGRRMDGGRPLYFAPDSELIAIADGQRIAIGRGDKPGGFSATGEYQDSIFYTLPFSDLEKLATAKKIELAIGQSEIQIDSHVKNKLLALYQAISR